MSVSHNEHPHEIRASWECKHCKWFNIGGRKRCQICRREKFHSIKKEAEDEPKEVRKSIDI